MNVGIKFDDLLQASTFANDLKEINLRGVKVSQAEKEPEEGALGYAEFLPLLELAISSGFAAAVVTSVFGLLKGIFVENRKAKIESEIEKQRIASNERIELSKIEKEALVEKMKTEHQPEPIELMFENKGKKINFKITRFDDAEKAELLNIVKKMT